jgi:hypothetical protein
MFFDLAYCSDNVDFLDDAVPFAMKNPETALKKK